MYYFEFIYKYEIINKINSSYFKALYKYLIKEFFACINKKNNF